MMSPFLLRIHLNSMNIMFIFIALLTHHPTLSNQISTIASDDLYGHFTQLAPGSSEHVLVHVSDGSSGNNVFLPIILLKGAHPGSTLAITAAIHGDEVTGVPVVNNLIKQIDVEQLHGEIVAIPVLNPFGFSTYQRGGLTGKDINRSFKTGTLLGVEMHYAKKLFDMLAAFKFDHHVDLHTATTGNDNSFYVRADLSSPAIMDVARVLQPQIILNTTRPTDSLREAMTSVGVVSVTVEMGGPVKVNNAFAQKGVESLLRLLQHLGMAPDVISENSPTPEPVVCSSSQWICSDYSGLAFLKVDLMTMVNSGQTIAEIQDLFGNSVLNVTSHQDGIVIGKTNRLPVDYGARLVHIGKIAAG